jgi:hypothetical protein
MPFRRHPERKVLALQQVPNQHGRGHQCPGPLFVPPLSDRYAANTSVDPASSVRA